MQITPQPATVRENLAGLVERVTFYNEDSGFCVLRVKARGQRDLITVVGHAAAIGVGEFVQASGRWVNDRTHGVQFRADFLRAAPPTTAEGIEKYLASGMIKGIGPIYAPQRALGRGVHRRRPDKVVCEGESTRPMLASFENILNVTAGVIIPRSAVGNFPR
jgi:exodeoxyribonuclease V alpha subunit